MLILVEKSIFKRFSSNDYSSIVFSCIKGQESIWKNGVSCLRKSLSAGVG